MAEMLIEQPMRVAGVDFVVTGVPADVRDGGRFLTLATMQRIAVLIANELARLGVVNGDAFKYLRKVAGLRAVDVAALLGRTPETISHWETGKSPVDRAAWAIVAAMVAREAGDPAQAVDRLRAVQSPPPRAAVVVLSAA